jgi:plasmid stability protein
MRTTIRLPNDLLKAAKRRAVETGRSLSALIEDALREALASKPERSRKRKAVRLPTFAGDGLLPGVHPEHSARLLDLMEGEAAPR